MRAALAIISTVLVAASIQAKGPVVAANPLAHVRALQKDADEVIAEGMEGSATFRRLVNRLERSSVIVYVDLRPDMRDSIGGSLRFLGKSATHRFLRVQINRADSKIWRVALLGHELQHAVEVADAEDVTSAEDLRELYRRIGVRMGADAYDSIAAREAGLTVRDEIAGSHGGNWRYARGGPSNGPAAGGEALGQDGTRDAAPAADRTNQ
jgi:hypothetical protein